MNVFAWILQLDTRLFLWLSSLPHPQWLTIFFLSVDFWTATFIPGVLIVVWLMTRGKRSREVALYGVCIVLLTLLLEGALIKSVLVRRPRPFVSLMNITLLGVRPGDLSFPSNQVSVLSALTLFYWKRYHKRIIVSVGSLSVFLTALARLYLRAHYPLDVLGGVCIGIMCGEIGYMLIGKIEQWRKSWR